MKYTAQQYAQSLYQLIKESEGKNLEPLLAEFAGLLRLNGALAMYPEIERELETLFLGEQGIVRAEFVTAREMEIGKDVLDTVKKIVGKELKIEHKIDKGLVGGLVVRVDDLLIDASIRRQLSDLRAKLER